MKSKRRRTAIDLQKGPRMNVSFKFVGALVTGSALISTSVASGQSTGLNAPILPSTPTVGSEIKRGADAGDR